MVIANPPYGLINKRQNKRMSIVIKNKDLNFFKNSSEYKPAISGMTNIYRLFVLRSITILRQDGIFIEIFPLSFIADVSASNLRKYILKYNSVNIVEAFPERDSEKHRVFETAKMSVCILQLQKGYAQSNKFFVRIHHDRFVDENNQKVFFNLETLLLFDKKNLTIPLMSKEEVEIIKKVYKQSTKFSEVGHCYTGELDLTLEKKYLTINPQHATLIKGAIIDKYLIRKEMSQGKIMFLDSKKYLSEKKGNKSYHHRITRIVMQGITGVNEKNRLKVTIIPPGVFCGNSANYIIFRKPKENIEYYLGILNSKLLNFIFEKFSTNSNVNGYEIDNLPNPRNISKKTEDRIANLVHTIIIAKRNNPAVNTSTLEQEINHILYQIYGLNEEEIRNIEEGK